MKTLYALLVANMKQFFRDRTALFFTFAFPIIFMVIFGFVFSGTENVSYEIGVANSDNSTAGTAIVQSIRQIPIFKVSEGQLADKLYELRNGGVNALVSIPADLQEDINTGQTANITVYYDPVQTTSSQIILSVLRKVIDDANRQITQEPLLLQISEQSIQTRDLSDIDFLIPGIIGMSILFLGLFGALPMVEWREKQVLKRFGATPIKRSTLVFSQVIYRLILAVIQTLIIIVIAFILFDVHMVGNWLVLLGLVILGTLTFVSLGYLAVSRAKTTEGAMPIIQLIQFPMLFLSGIFFPVEFIPDFMRPVVMAMPLTYLGDAMRQVMVNAVPLYPLAVDIAVLIGCWILSMVLAIRLFRWE